MKPKYPHILQTLQWGMAKCSAQPSWSGKLWVKFIDSADWDELETLDHPIPQAGHPSYDRFDKLTASKEGKFDWSQVKSSVLILERNLPFGQKMQYIPRGPFVDWSNSKNVKEVLAFIKGEAEKSNVLFTRFEPNAFEPDFPYDLVKEMGFVQTNDFVQAHDTVKIEIDKNDEELMDSFHSKHRYNIRLAQKRGLTVRSSIDPKDVSIFYELTKKTDSRKEGAMNPHPLEYYLSLVKVLGESGMAKVYIVEKEGKPVSASIVFIFGEEAIYMFGASDYEYRRDMPNHLREWVSMRDARDAGCKWFDLWGLTMRNDPGEGIKRYKLGYSEKIFKMAGTFDYAPVKWKYTLFDMANKVRRALGR